MRIVTWTIRLILFTLLLAFAVKNTEPVSLRFYFDLLWEAPLVLVLFGFFVVGALAGVLALVSTLLRQRREIVQLRRQVRKGTVAGGAAATTPPAIDA